MSSQPSATDFVARWTFLLSNFLFLIPAVYVLLPKINQTFSNRVIHSFLCVVIAVVSFLYHFCDNEASEYNNYASIHCIASYKANYIQDRIVSVLVSINVLTYNMPHGFEWIRDIAIAIGFIAPIYITNLDRGDEDIQSLYTFGFIFSFIIIGIRGFLRYLRKDSRFYQWPLRQRDHIIFWFPFEGRIWVGILSLLCWLGAVLCFTTEENGHYYLKHSGWHSFAAFGVFTGFYFFDSMKLSVEYELHVTWKQINALFDMLIILVKNDPKTVWRDKIILRSLTLKEKEKVLKQLLDQYPHTSQIELRQRTPVNDLI